MPAYFYIIGVLVREGPSLFYETYYRLSFASWVGGTMLRCAAVMGAFSFCIAVRSVHPPPLGVTTLVHWFL